MTKVRFLISVLALMFSAAAGSALAQDAPVDCKKTPEHPRCADKK